jgi:hypothetical protein
MHLANRLSLLPPLNWRVTITSWACEAESGETLDPANMIAGRFDDLVAMPFRPDHQRRWRL